MHKSAHGIQFFSLFRFVSTELIYSERCSREINKNEFRLAMRGVRESTTFDSFCSSMN